MTQDLIDALCGAHGITVDTASDLVRAHFDQIRSDEDLVDPETGELTPTGADLIFDVVKSEYASGLLGSAAQQILEDIAAAAAEISATKAARDAATNRRDELIRQALSMDLRREDIATAAGLREARLYQIRDGRR